MKIKDLKIKTKLFISFGLLIILMAAIGAVAFVNVGNIHALLNYNERLNEIKDKMNQREVDHVTWVNNVMAGINDGSLVKSGIETDYHKCALGRWYYSDERTKAESLFPEIKVHLAGMEEPHKKLHESAIKIIRAMEDRNFATVQDIIKNETNTGLIGVRGELTNINNSVKAKVAESQGNITASIGRVQSVTLILGLLAVLAGIVLSFLVAGSITVTVKAVLGFAGMISKGDFTERIDLDQKDELGQLGKALNDAADNLETLISEVLVSSQNLAQAVQEISSGNENLSQRTSEQASSLEEVASTIEEATASIRQNAQNAVDANRNAEETGRVVQKAKEVSNRAIVLAEEGGKVVVDAVASIEEVNRSSQKITDILGVINEIAFQTNLLALNAAVEAARAGEQGRGFAVVAGEVRNLAQRSAGASKEIGDMIKESIRKVEAGTAMVNRSGEALKKIIESVKENGDSLDGVILAVQNVTNLISEIATASEEQKRGTDQINIAVSELDTMTQQNAALVEETASASEEMASQAREMLEMVERFEVRDELKKKTYDAKHKEVHLRETRKPALENKTGTGVKSRKMTAKLGDADFKKVMAEDGFDEF